MSREVRFEDFESRHFKVHVDSLYGVWRLIRKSDDALTLWFVCSEGWEYYQEMKRAYRKSRRIFDSLCMEHTFD